MMEIFCHSSDDEESFNDEYSLFLETCIGKEYLFQVKTDKDNEEYLFRMKSFLKMTVNDIVNLENTHSPISITVIKKNA